ncbi:MAG TPA: diguanylate cyclase [Lysobacter sp.]|nr:diguanylate cyclase [Lysobacter sp.]
MDGRELLQAIVDSPTSHAIMFTDVDGVIRLWNAGAAMIFQYAEDEIVGQHADVLFLAEDLARGVQYEEMADARDRGCSGDFRWHVRKDGSTFWADAMMYPVKDRGGEILGYVKVLRDATEQKKLEDEISRLALADALTGLPNRAEFQQRLGGLIAAAHRHERAFIVLLLDLDHFKEVNDRLGHHGGDALLQQAAHRMQAVTRETDLVARLGGDEFGILLADADDPNVGGIVADKLVTALSRPFQIENQEVQIGASIGISVFPQDAVDADQLLRNADLALYRAKFEGRNGYQYFTELMDIRAHQRSRELARLARVSARDFYLHYQPVVDANGKVIGVEALLRCSDAFFSGYPIERVVALAAETGKLREVGMRLLAKACAQVARWQRAGWPHLHLTVNFRRMEIGHMGLADRVARTAAAASLPLEDFEADLGESQLHGGRHDDVTLRDISACGVAITIDDFGGERASLLHLSPMIRRIKLDLQHFPGIPDNQRSCAVATAIIQLAHALGLSVTVECVQTAAEAEFFRDKCDGMQGFHFAEPMTSREMSAWLAARRPGSVPAMTAAAVRSLGH